VVCTAVAATTPHGSDLREILRQPAPVAQRRASGAGGVARDAEAYRRWGAVPLDDEQFASLNQAKYFDRCTKMAYCSSRHVFGGRATAFPKESTSIVVGSAFSTLRDQMDMMIRLEQGGVRAVEPVLFPNLVYNCPASRLAIIHGSAGPTSTMTNGLCSGLDAVIHAAQMLRLGRASHVLACGVEELSEYTAVGYHHCAREPEEADFYPIEASGAAMLTSEESARAAGDVVLGRLVHYRQSFFPGRIADAAAYGRAIAENLTALMSESDVDPRRIGTILLSMNGFAVLDRAELAAMEQVISALENPVALVALKRIIGEGTGASGLLQLATALGGGLDVLDVEAHHRDVLPEAFRARHGAKLAARARGSHGIICNVGWMGNHTAVLVERAS
jgi:3-oxoacyl-(acyl-carrier-protein) synthase